MFDYYCVLGYDLLVTPREIIARAWAITRKQRGVRWWGYTSSFFETLLHLKMLIYQTYFFWSFMIAGNTIGFFEIEEIIYRSVPFPVFATVMTLIVVLLIVEFFIPSFCLGAVIGLGAKAHREEEVNGGWILGLYNFFPLFVVREIAVLSSVSLAVTLSSLIFRYGGSPDMVSFLLAALWFLWLFSVVLKFLICFSEEAIVIRKVGMFTAMGMSFKLVLSHLSKIVFLLVLLFVISLRIVINAAMALLLPALIFGFAFLFSTFLSATVTTVLTGLIAIILVALSSYLFAYLEVFKQTAWTITFLELSKLKELDVIE